MEGAAAAVEAVTAAKSKRDTIKRDGTHDRGRRVSDKDKSRKRGKNHIMRPKAWRSSEKGVPAKWSMVTSTGVHPHPTSKSTDTKRRVRERGERKRERQTDRRMKGGGKKVAGTKTGTKGPRQEEH